MLSQPFTKHPMPMDAAKWWREARRAATYYWCYEDLCSDAADDLERAFIAGTDPYDAVKEIGQDLGLHEFGPAWGGW
jgi:hypothetical protein